MPVKMLEWDSRFFGYPVGSVAFRGAPPTVSDVQGSLREAQGAGVRLLYLFMPPVDADLRSALEQTGAKSMGRKRDYAKSVGMPRPSDLGADIVLCRESSVQLERLALLSGAHSRFRIDPGFRNGEFERLYREWLAASLRGENGKRVFVAGSPEGPQGLLTLEPGAVARIGLLAVSDGWRGKGLGRRLMAEAERFCCQHNPGELRVATQTSNQGACRFYEAGHFQVISEIETFHAWFSDDPAG